MSRLETLRGIIFTAENMKAPRLVATASREIQAIRRQLRVTRGENGRYLQIAHREIMRQHRAARRQKDVRRKLDNLVRARAWKKKRWIKTLAVPKKLKAKAAPSKLAKAASAKLAKAASANPASEPEKLAKAASAKPASEPEKVAKAASTKPLKIICYQRTSGMAPRIH